MIFRLSVKGSGEGRGGRYNLVEDQDFGEVLRRAEEIVRERREGGGQSEMEVDAGESSSDEESGGSESDDDEDDDDDGGAGSNSSGGAKRKKISRSALDSAILSLVNPGRFDAITYGGVVEFTAEEVRGTKSSIETQKGCACPLARSLTLPTLPPTNPTRAPWASPGASRSRSCPGWA